MLVCISGVDIGLIILLLLQTLTPTDEWEQISQMNLCGSYRALRNNAKSALFAAIEIYNKPQIEYRDECFVILLVNAWELLLKAILSKHKQRIFYPKKLGESYRTLSIQDVLTKVAPYFPANLQHEPVAKNIDALVDYRNSAIHFYNQPGFGVIVYGLAQTSIINFRDVMEAFFGLDIADEVTLNLLPLSFSSQPDPIAFLQDAKANPPKSRVIAQFLQRIMDSVETLESHKCDTGRFLMTFKVKLESVKKVTVADITVGIAAAADESMAHVIEKRVDPNVSHPLRRKDILKEIGSTLNGTPFGPHVFEVMAWKQGLKAKPHLCWIPKGGGSAMYSEEVLALLRTCKPDEVEAAKREYNKEKQNRKRQK